MKIKEFVDLLRKELAGKEDALDIEQIEDFIKTRTLREEDFENLSLEEISKIVKRAFYSIKNDMSVLSPYIEDNSISEIMVNSYNKIFVEKNGQIQQVNDSFFNTEEFEDVIRRMAGNVHREINELVPIVDARLDNGSRVNAVYKNVAIGGPALTIRKFPESHITMDQLIEFGTLTKEAADFIKNLMNAGYNFFVSGGTSSGKTTFLNAISDFIPTNERVIVIEDSIELVINNVPNIVRLECKVGTAHNKKADVGMDQLIKSSLRMRPDKIIIGEIRDGEALMNMLNGLNTGHSGLCTGHSNSVSGMVRRMEALYMQVASFPIEAIDEQIAEGINIIVHLARLKDSSRKVIDVSEIYINEDRRIGINPLFQLENGQLKKTENSLKNTTKLDFYNLY